MVIANDTYSYSVGKRAGSTADHRQHQTIIVGQGKLNNNGKLSSMGQPIATQKIGKMNPNTDYSYSINPAPHK